MYQFDIVDDHKMFAESLGKTLPSINPLLKTGNIFLTAHDYLLHLKTHKNHNSNVVLIDYRMPGLLGWHLSLLLQEQYPHIIKIGMSGDTVPEWIELLMSTGCKTFVSKDDDCAELANAIVKISTQKKYLSKWVGTELTSQTIKKKDEIKFPYGLTQKEYLYIHLCQTNLTHQAIALLLNIGYEAEHKMQKQLNKKFDVQSRSQLVSYAIHKKIITTTV